MDSRLFYHLWARPTVSVAGWLWLCDDTNHYEWLFIESQLWHTNRLHWRNPFFHIHALMINNLVALFAETAMMQCDAKDDEGKGRKWLTAFQTEIAHNGHHQELLFQWLLPLCCSNTWPLSVGIINESLDIGESGGRKWWNGQILMMNLSSLRKHIDYSGTLIATWHSNTLLS